MRHRDLKNYYRLNTGYLQHFKSCVVLLKLGFKMYNHLTKLTLTVLWYFLWLLGMCSWNYRNYIDHGGYNIFHVILREPIPQTWQPFTHLNQHLKISRQIQLEICSFNLLYIILYETVAVLSLIKYTLNIRNKASWIFFLKIIPPPDEALDDRPILDKKGW